MEKQCKRCEKALPMAEFYRHSAMADGFLNFCKACVKNRVNLHRQSNLESYREYDRGRYRSNESRRQQLRDFSRNASLDPVKNKAWKATSNAIRDGRLERPDACSSCGITCKPEAHHEDYSSPLDVCWLCRSCHCKLHRLQSLPVVHGGVRDDVMA